MIEFRLYALPRQLITKKTNAKLECQFVFDKRDCYTHFIVKEKWRGNITEYLEHYFQTYHEALDFYNNLKEDL